MMLFQAAILISTLGLFGTSVTQGRTIKTLKESLDRQSRDFHSALAKKGRYIPEDDGFVLHIERPAVNDASDLEIVEWARSKKIRFDYNYSFQSYDGDEYIEGALQLWIENPKLAMEYKLRWHNV